MKKYKFIILALVGLFMFSACEHDLENILDLEQSTPPAITNPAANTQFELLAANASDEIVFEISLAQFSATVATEYILEVSAESTFTDARRIEASFNKQDGKFSTTVANLNRALLALEFEPLEEADAFIRVVALVNSTSLTLASESLTIKVIPYKIAADGTTDDGTRIYMIGAAVPSGWNPDEAIEMVNIAPDTYRTTTTFTNERFRFFGQKDWGPISYNFPYFTSVPEEYFENARQPDREDGDENLWFKGEPGDYIITVDLGAKTITMTPASDDGTVDDGTRIYIVGAAVPAVGWDAANAQELVNIAPNVYRATVELENERFRFLKQQDWGDGYNFPYFTGYVNNMLENARQPDREDGDENLWFKGTPGTYVVTVDVEKKTVELDLPYSDDGTFVYLVGAAVTEVGWDAANALAMKNIAPNRYRVTTAFEVERFRFLKQQDWGDGYNFPFFTSVPEQYLENALQPDREDGDENLWFKGPAGTYTITIDVDEKWITMY